jgi:BlaI family transcriptional regulator, penicillinase repressor
MRISFTDRELDIMLVLWERGPSTVTEVRDALADDLARNTVLTMLKILCEKGYVRRDESERTHRYVAAVAREAAGESAATRLVRRLFGNSPSLLMTQLIQRRGLSDAELRELRALIDRELRDAEQ